MQLANIRSAAGIASQRAAGIAQVCVALGIGRTSVYALIRSGQLRAVKIGRRTIVLSEDLERYLGGLRAIEPKAKAEV